VRGVTCKNIYFKTESQGLDEVLGKLRPYLGHEKMREERKELGLKEVEANWKVKSGSKMIAFESVEKGEAERAVWELREAFLREEERVGGIWMNAVGFELWKRAGHEPDAEKEDVPGAEFPFLGLSRGR
jgi:hypothetical protein